MYPSIRVAKGQKLIPAYSGGILFYDFPTGLTITADNGSGLQKSESNTHTVANNN